MEDGVDATVHHDPGHIKRGASNGGVNRAAAVPLLNHARRGRRKALLDLRGHLGCRRKANGLGQGVVDLGKNLPLHLLHRDDVLHGLALDLVPGVLIGILDREGLRLSGRDTHERLGECRQDALATQLDELTASAGTLNGLAVGGGLVIDQRKVACGGGAIDVLQARTLLAHTVDLGLNCTLGDLVGLTHDLEPLVLTKHRGGRHLQGDAELHALLSGLAEINLGVADWVDARAHEGQPVPVGQRPVERLGKDALATHALDDHVGGHLARAEAR